MPKCATIRNKK